MHLPRKVFQCVVANKPDAVVGIEIGLMDVTVGDNCSGTLIG